MKEYVSGVGDWIREEYYGLVELQILLKYKV